MKVGDLVVTTVDSVLWRKGEIGIIIGLYVDDSTWGVCFAGDTGKVLINQKFLKVISKHDAA